MAASASIRMRSLSSRLTAKGSSSNGVRYVSVTGGVSSSSTGAQLGRLRGARDLERLARDALGLFRLEQRARAEAPRAVDQHAHAESGARVRGRRLEGAVLDGQALGLALDDADVGVARHRRAERRRGRVRSVPSRHRCCHDVGFGAHRLLDRARGLRREIALASPAPAGRSTSVSVKRALIDCSSSVRMPPGRSIADSQPVGRADGAASVKLEPIVDAVDLDRARAQHRDRPAVMRMSSTAIASAPALRSS